MILVSGSLAYDRIMDYPGYFRDHIDPKKLHVLSVSFMVRTFKENFGGTAGNIAYNLALLGERSTMLASVGSDFDGYERWLQSHRVERHFMCRRRGTSPRATSAVDLSWVRRVKDTPTASAYIMTDQADCQITAFYPGAMNFRFKISGFSATGGSALGGKTQILKKVKLAIVAPGNIEDMRALPRLYKKYKIPYIFDPGQALPALSKEDLSRGISGARVFICNDYELEMTLKKTGWQKKDLIKKVEMLVTTLGERGSVIECGMRNAECGKLKIPNSKLQIHNSTFNIPIPPAKPRNTSDPTGAGDAYRAGLIKGLLMGLPYDKIGKLASVVSVYTVEKYGTQTHSFTWPALLKRYKENFGEKLV